MLNFLKGIFIGLGAVAPGLSGSILLVLFGLYQKTTHAISTIFKKFKQNILFLLPLGLGILLGVFLFSRLVDFLLNGFEKYTRFAFFGLISGSVPLFYREVTKHGFGKKYAIITACAFVAGFSVFNLADGIFPTVTSPTVLQSVVLGLTVAASYIVPGIDSAAVLSSLGLYELWITSLSELDYNVLIPAGFGFALGALEISVAINRLIAKCYTATFSVIFGLFLSVVPNVLNSSCMLSFDISSLIAGVLFTIGFVLSLLFGKIKVINGKN